MGHHQRRPSLASIYTLTISREKIRAAIQWQSGGDSRAERLSLVVVRRRHIIDGLGFLILLAATVDRGRERERERETLHIHTHAGVSVFRWNLWHGKIRGYARLCDGLSRGIACNV